MSGAAGINLVLETHGGDPENLYVNWDPCTCLNCKEPLQQPVFLHCHHILCTACARDSISNRENSPENCVTLICPVCSKECVVNYERETFKTDSLVKYIVNSSQEKAELCANCDETRVPMCYCETCQQPLCVECKEITHQAKMFDAHSIVPLEERIGCRAGRMCPTHSQPYILFTSDTKTLACIACFRLAALSQRSHFNDVDLAYKNGVDKVEKVSMKLKTMQQSVRDDIMSQTRFTIDYDHAFKRVRGELLNICQEVVDRVWKVRDDMLNEMIKHKDTNQQQLAGHVTNLSSYLPSIQLYLLCSSIFCSCADKLDFLQYTTDLLKRMNSVMNEYNSMCPSNLCALPDQSQASIREELANALQPIIGLTSKLFFPPLRADSELDFGGLGSQSPSPHGSASGRRVKTSGGYVNLPIHSMSKYQLIVDLAGAFGDEFGKVDQPLKELQSDMTCVSVEAQEMLRDITQRRCMVHKDSVEILVGKCDTLDSKLSAHAHKMNDVAPNLQSLWQEQLDRVRRQQIMYKQLVDTSVQVRDDLRRVSEMVTKMQPFTETIAKALQVCNPRRCHPPDPAPMEQICLQIQTLAPDSQMRVDAIEKGEERRREELKLRNELGSVHIRDAKKSLKTTRRAKTDKVVKHFGRDRSRGGTDPGLLSPGSRKGIEREGRSPTTMLGADLMLIQSDDASSMDDSFDSDRPLSVNDPPSSVDEAVCTFDLSCEDASDKVQVTRLARSQTVHVSKNVGPHQNGPPCPPLSSSLPAVVDVLPSNIPKPPPAPKQPPKGVTSNREWDPSTIGARERVLEDLKERVKRVDIGVSNSPERTMSEGEK